MLERLPGEGHTGKLQKNTQRVILTPEQEFRLPENQKKFGEALKAIAQAARLTREQVTRACTKEQLPKNEGPALTTHVLAMHAAVQQVAGAIAQRRYGSDTLQYKHLIAMGSLAKSLDTFVSLMNLPLPSQSRDRLALRGKRKNAVLSLQKDAANTLKHYQNQKNKETVLTALGLSPTLFLVPVSAALPVLGALSLTACGVPMTVAPEFENHITSSLAVEGSFPFRHVHISPTVRPQDLTIAVGGFIVPVISKQSIVVNVLADESLKGVYVFSGTEGKTTYQVNMDKALFDWCEKNGYTCSVEITHGVQGAQPSFAKYAPTYTANIQVRIERPGFSTKNTKGNQLTRRNIRSTVGR